MGFGCLVRDQEAVGSNPIAPTISFGTNNLQAHEIVVDRLVLDQEVEGSSAFAPTTPNSYLSLVYAAFIVSTATTVCVAM